MSSTFPLNTLYTRDQAFQRKSNSWRVYIFPQSQKPNILHQFRTIPAGSRGNLPKLWQQDSPSGEGMYISLVPHCWIDFPDEVLGKVNMNLAACGGYSQATRQTCTAGTVARAFLGLRSGRRGLQPEDLQVRYRGYIFDIEEFEVPSI
jgi:hypothetical protein